MSQIDTLPRLTKQQLPQAIAMISRAFHKDPLSIYVYPEGAERISRLPLLFSIPLRYCSRYGEITTTPEITGAACWLPPGSTTMHMGQMLLTGALTSIFKMGSPGLKRLAIVDDYTRNMHQRCITEPHWYLMVLGVDPKRQGQGIGSKLLSAGIERADASGLPCYLETMNPDNVPLYQKFGFAVANEGDIPDSNVHVWGMVRPAGVHL
ncbi:MAG TPA: GNAT family N-acetyltransferase [Ktedonobacteraceae bacterium]|nr:GNAT family N-acetyltransferase [Ktedonobacteraceae bacterium]